MSSRPLADEIRPRSLDEVVGQRHLIGPGGVLRRLIDAGTSANMIFYGPSGTGKTTIANIIADKTNKTLYRLNATTASLTGREGHHRERRHADGARRAFCSTSTRFSISTKSSSRACWSSWRTAPSRSSRPRRRIRFSMFTTRCSRARTVFEFKQVEPREAAARR